MSDLSMSRVLASHIADLSPEDAERKRAHHRAYYARKKLGGSTQVGGGRMADCVLCGTAIQLPLHQSCLPRYLKIRQAVIEAHEAEKAKASIGLRTVIETGVLSSEETQ